MNSRCRSLCSFSLACSLPIRHPLLTAAFGKVVACLAKIGEDLYFEPRADEVRTSTPVLSSPVVALFLVHRCSPPWALPRRPHTLSRPILTNLFLLNRSSPLLFVTHTHSSPVSLPLSSLRLAFLSPLSSRSGQSSLHHFLCRLTPTICSLFARQTRSFSFLPLSRLTFTLTLSPHPSTAAHAPDGEQRALGLRLLQLPPVLLRVLQRSSRRQRVRLGSEAERERRRYIHLLFSADNNTFSPLISLFPFHPRQLLLSHSTASPSSPRENTQADGNFRCRILNRVRHHPAPPPSSPSTCSPSTPWLSIAPPPAGVPGRVSLHGHD